MRLIDRYLNPNFTSYKEFSTQARLTIPENFNFAYDVVDEYAENDPSKIALVWCDDHGREKTFTFADIKKHSDKAANLLRSKGVGAGDVVMLILKRRYHYWFLSMALCKLGAVMIPGTYLLTDKDIAYRVNAAGVKMIISVPDDEIVCAIEAAAPDCPTLEHVALVDGVSRGACWDYDEAHEASGENFVPGNPPPQDSPMLVYFTSGTTGMPKMVSQSFTYPLGHIVSAHYWHGTREDDLHITVADTGWAKASWGKIYGQWICGTAQFVYDMDKFVPELLAEKLAKYRVTSFCAPPTIYRFLIKTDLTKYDFSALRTASTAGEPLSAEVYNQFKRMFGIEIREAFGQSESTPILGNFVFDSPRPGSLGRPNPLYRVLLLDEHGDDCEAGEEGEIVIDIRRGKPAGMFDGYFRDAKRTEEAFADGLYHTGDTAWIDENGYYWFIGRADDVIKSSGYRIGPFEVESALISHPAVLECAISAAPDPVRGQIVKATVVLAKGYEPSEQLKKELQEHVKKITAPYKYPRVVEFVAELPKTVSGKIKRAQLRIQSIENARKFE